MEDTNNPSGGLSADEGARALIDVVGDLDGSGFDPKEVSRDYVEDDDSGVVYDDLPPEGEEDDRSAKPKSGDDEEDDDVDAGEEDTDDDDDDGDDLPKHKVKDGDWEGEVTTEEAVNGYMRTANYTRKTQALAERARAVEARENAIQQKLQTADEQLAILEEFVDPKEPDWSALRGDPDRLAAAVDDWKERRTALNVIKQRREGIQKEQNESFQKARTALEETERRRLFTAIPALKDPQKGPKIRDRIYAYAENVLGVSPKDLNGVLDHRLWNALYHGSRWHALQVKKIAVRQQTKPNTPVLKPGARRSTTQTTAGRKARRQKELDARLTKTGSREDARALLMEMPDDV